MSGKIVRTLPLFLFLALIAPAQTPNASLLGTVSDASGAVMTAAQIKLISLDTKVVTATTSSSLGTYQFASILAGRYRVEFTAPNFKTNVVDDVVFRVGDQRKIDIALQPGEARESLTITDTAPLTETERATSATVINEKAVQELPLNGRQLQNLTLFVPGVSGGWNLSTASNRYGKARENLEGAFNMNGARSRSNNFIFDGMPMIIRQYSVLNFEPSNEAIQEFEVKTALPPAEFGRTMGGVVSIVTKTGSSSFHGAAYEFFRNDKLDSNSTFNTRAGLPRGKVRQNQFGGSLGGPIWKNQHFFFVNSEYLHNLESTETRLTSVATADERAGRIPYTAANGTRQVLDLSSRINPVTAKLLGLYPAPNFGTANGPNYNAALPISLDDYQYHIRTDHHLTSRDLLTLRTSWNLNDQIYILNRFSGPFIPNFPLVNPERTTNGTLAYNRTFGATVQNEARIGFNRYGNVLGNGDQTNAAELGLPHGAVANGIPFITFPAGTIENVGGPGGNSREQNENTAYGSNTLSILRGKHSIKIGGDLTRLHYNTRGASNQRGTVLFDGTKNGMIPVMAANNRANVLADFLLGLPQQASITVGQFGRGYRQWSYGFFAQDSWRITPRLTLNYGIRYEYSAPWTEVNNKLANLDVAKRDLVTPATSGWNGLYQPDRNNFGPRLGFAYDVTGDTKTIIRGGYAVLYETLLQSSIVQPIENNPPFSAAAVTFAPTPFASSGTSNTLLDLRNSALPSRSIAAVPMNLRSPYSQQFTFGIQRALGDAWVAEMGYAATSGVRLPLTYNINQVPINSLSDAQRATIRAAGSATAAIIDPLRPYPNFNTINVFDNAAQSIYHGLQLSLKKRLRGGLNLLAAYAWSKSIDNASDIATSDSSEKVVNSYDLRAQRGLSSFDIPHRFTAAFNYALPFRVSHLKGLVEGWQTNGNITIQSGQPFTPYTSINDPFRNEVNNHLDVLGDPNANIPAGLAFNPAVFRTPAAGTFGASGRNIVRGDNYKSVDLSLFKNTRITEQVRLQLRLELMNSLNTVNFQGPVTNLAASNPGAFISQASPRVIQLGAKITF